MLTVELFGLSRSGKTSALRGLLEEGDQKGYKCSSIGRAPIDFKDCSSVGDFHTRMLDYFESQLDNSGNQESDFLFLDRGPYDREVMLGVDHSAGLIGNRTYETERKRSLILQQVIDLPLLFLVDPEISEQRKRAQRSEGLDYSHLCDGLETNDELEGLRKLFRSYSDFGDRKTGVTKVLTKGNLGTVVDSVGRIIFSEKVKNPEEIM